MKIALVHRYYSLRGAVTPIVDASIIEYKKQNIDYYLFSEKPEKNGIARPFRKAFSFYFKLFSEFKKGKFDLIVTHSYPVCFLRPFIKTPVVLIVHNTGREEFAVEKNGPIQLLKNRVSVFFRSKSFRLADKLLVVSNMVKEILINRYGVDENKILVSYNGLNSNFFNYYNLPIKNNNKFVILQRGSDSRKGFDLLLQWAPKIIQAIPNVEFLVLGEKKELPKNLEKYFIFKEWVDYKSMPKIYSSVDLVICPSKYDPFPGVPLEAMACKKPVIMSDLCGTKELVIDGENAFVSNLKDFQDKIIYVSRMNKGQLKKIGLNARATIIKRLSWEKIVKQQIKEFSKIIK